MPNPLQALTPALQVLAENLDILPATGVAITDLQQPDQEEIEDRLLNRGENKVDMIIERPSNELYRLTPPLHRRERCFFRHFLDGSRQSYFIGTVIENDRATPIQLAQIGAAVVERDDEGQLHIAATRNCLLLLLARDKLSDEIWGKLEELTAGSDELQLIDIGEEDMLNGPATGHIDLRSRGGGKVNYAMHILEIELTNELERAADDWMIVDGSVKFKPSIEAPRVVGVSKSGPAPLRRNHF